MSSFILINESEWLNIDQIVTVDKIKSPDGDVIVRLYIGSSGRILEKLFTNDKLADAFLSKLNIKVSDT